MHSLDPDIFGKTFSSFVITRSRNSASKEDIEASRLFINALTLRDKFLTPNKTPVYPDHHTIAHVTTPDTTHTIALVDGCYFVHDATQTPIFVPVSYQDYLTDYRWMLSISDNGPAQSLARQRLSELEHKFTLHNLMNTSQAQTTKSPLDIHTIAMVDTHIHSAACMTEKTLLEFLKEKNRNCKDEIVGYYTTDSGEKELETLGHMCQRLNIDLDNITLNQLGVRASLEFFNRFDIFNQSYRIGGEDILRTVFLKSENYMNGKYFAELIKKVFKTLDNTNTFVELRLSIYGRNKAEWSRLAKWIDKWDLQHKQNRWVIQFPRIFHVCAANKPTFTFNDYVANLFEPLFEATQHPERDPVLAEFLTQVSGFDSVDDESVLEQIIASLPPAGEWTVDNPPYFYYMYYMYANIASLNMYRQQRGLNTFDFRPHCGESGHISHLAAAFLTAKSINHGIRLLANWSLQYLYYLATVGLAVSPLSNHNLFLQYDKNPFNDFFKRGLNVSLSSDDPLQFHRTQTPLLEEYANAQHMWNYVSGDIGEIAFNSVVQSGFTVEEKERMVGERYWLFSSTNASRTLLTPFRRNYRQQMLQYEFLLLRVLMGGMESVCQSELFASIPFSNITLYHPEECPAEDIDVIRRLEYWLDVRDKYLTNCTRLRGVKKRSFFHPNTNPQLVGAMNDGVMNVYDEDVVCDSDQFHLAAVFCFDCNKKFCHRCFKQTHRSTFHSLHALSADQIYSIHSAQQFFEDYNGLTKFCRSGVARSFCFTKLHTRTELFRLYKILNERNEGLQIRMLPTDFEKTVKVDNHVHANRSFHPLDLLDIIQEKLRTEPGRVVCRDVTIKSKHYDQITLKELFDTLDVKTFTTKALKVQADSSTVQRYDLWLERYYPFGHKILKDLFLSSHNIMHGEYMYQLLKRSVFTRNMRTQNIRTEYRMSICGMKYNEFETLATELVQAGLIIPEINRYVVCVPRLYTECRRAKHVSCFAEFLKNIFHPAFEATLAPHKHPELAAFLANVGAFDTTFEEVKNETPIDPEHFPTPEQWTSDENPPYNYYMYYFYANITILNGLREDMHLNTFEFRPHCGEAGDPMHNAAAFLTAHSISHGVTLDEQNTLQYLFVLAQIGVSSSPTVQKAVYDRPYDPFYKFFERGMRISLSTDKPLNIHTTKEPLIEEYSNATKEFRLSSTDLAEIVRNSIIISSFPKDLKERWIGENFLLMGKEGNTPTLTNVPDTRVDFRYSVLQNEVDTFERFLKKTK